jgi:hypothetical protein
MKDMKKAKISCFLPSFLQQPHPARSRKTDRRAWQQKLTGRLGLCFVGCIAFSLMVVGEESNGYRLQELLAKIAATWDENVARNARGEVVSLRLSGVFSAETNLTLLTSLASLTNVTLKYSRETPLTAKAVASLSAIPNLTSVQLACFFGRLEPGVFTQLCNIKNLSALTLYGTHPTQEEFCAITNLQNLTSFTVDFSTNFGKQELSLLTALPRLNSLVVGFTTVKNTDTNILKSCLSLTNFVFDSTSPSVGGRQIIRVPSAAEMENGAQIEITTNMDSEK